MIASGTNYKGQSKRLREQLKLALSLMTNLQRKKFNQAFEEKVRERAVVKAQLVNRRSFAGYVPGQEKPASDRMDLGE